MTQYKPIPMNIKVEPLDYDTILVNLVPNEDECQMCQCKLSEPQLIMKRKYGGGDMLNRRKLRQRQLEMIPNI